MSQLKEASLGELRAVALALCENNNKITKRFLSFRSFMTRYSREILDAADHVVFIQQATRKDLRSIELGLCQDEDIKKRVENYLQVVRYSKLAEVATEAADPSNPLKNATAKELHNVMLALCEDENAKTRVNNHLRVLRRAKLEEAAFAEADPVALVDSPTEMELRAIGLAMFDRDEEMKERILESFQVISIFGKLQGTEARNTSFQCLRCKTSYYEGNNAYDSCWYHPGRFQKQLVMHDELTVQVTQWTCCGRGAYETECASSKHCHK